jgi:hypothetical protein
MPVAGSSDPLVDNGLGSPICQGQAAASALSQSALENCRTSGFVGAAAPTANYAFDVYAEGGLFGLDPRALFQEYLLAPAWIVLVWAVHSVLVMLEWCYSIDLLDVSPTSGVGRGLRETQATLTQPWLVIVLAVASVLALYHGLVRRQVAQTVGQVLLMGAMMAGGLWVIINPSGTVGALGKWANQASLGTLGAAAQGTPTDAPRTLADSVRAVFVAGIEGPWCYMEFGDVRWCRDPALLDPRLRAAALRIAASESAQVGCRADFSCAAQSAQARASSTSAALLRAARTNGELFLALPANTGPRNSTGKSGALLRVLCGSSDIGSCQGPTAAQAQFRRTAVTEQRAAGLLLILIGAVSMILLFGFLALHLLASAILGLFYLLLAPAAVLAPALGDGGRAAFQGWAKRLLGALVSKLFYSLLLGVLFSIERILLSLQGLGWWTQWLLISALWWSVFHHRHQVLGFAHGEHRQSLARPHGVGARLREVLQTPREIARGAGWVKDKLSRPAPDVEQRKALTEAARQRSRRRADEQVTQMLDHEHREASAHAAAAPRIQSQLADKQSQLARVRGAHGKAMRGGDARHAARLAFRARRIEGEIAQGQLELTAARQLVARAEKTRRRNGHTHTREQHEGRARFLDAQAALPAGLRKARAGAESGHGSGPTLNAQASEGAVESEPPGRDYAALASLIGHGREEYRRLDPASRRQARLQIDRELALRRELSGAAQDVAASTADQLGRRERLRVERDFDRALERRLGEAGHSLPASYQQRQPLDSWLMQARARASESPVMRDAHEVAQRRKRQLGRTPRR